jgi:hypothetical protein
MQRSERLVEYENQEWGWVPLAPFRWRKVNGAARHLSNHTLGTWDMDRGDWDALMILRIVEQGLDETIPHWAWDAKKKVWKNSGLGQ